VFLSKKKETRMVRIIQSDELALPARRTTIPQYLTSTVSRATYPSVLQYTIRHEIASNSMSRRLVERATECRDLERATMFFPAVGPMVTSLRKIIGQKYILYCDDEGLFEFMNER
jgi:hypothetical protein